MALSFSDSLKKHTESIDNQTKLMAVESEPTVANAPLMTLEENFGIEAYSGDDGSWQQHTDYVRYYNLSDENISTINDRKEIALNDKQINITQEENSQYIPFEMSRYYDGYDLVNAVISIHYETKTGVHGASKAVNVTFNNNKIRFGWLVDAGATIDAGALSFEIHAYGSITGSDGVAKGYVWKTKSNNKINVLQSICDCEEVTNHIDDSWVQELVTNIAQKVADEIKDVAVGEQVEAAKNAAVTAEQHANTAKQYADNASSAAMEAVNTVLADYATTNYVDEAVAGVDVTGQLVSYVKTSDLEANYYTRTDTEQRVSNILEGYATKDDVANAIDSAELDNYYKKDETYSSAEIDEKVANVKVDLTGYATEKFVTDKTDTLSASIDTNAEDIATLSKTVVDLQDTVNSVDTSPRLTYDVDYNDIENPDVGENVFVLYEIENEGKENEVREAKKKFTIVGGSGDSSTSSMLKIEYVTKSPIVATINDNVVIKYNFYGTDSSGDDITDGTATWKVDGRVVATNTAVSGENSFDITEYISVGTQKVNLTITDDAGSLVSKNWTVQKIDVRLESSFNDSNAYPAGEVEFQYTPYGSIQKTVHFVLDGVEIGTIETTVSGIPMSFMLPSQEHGSHLLDVYITATINGNDIESNHVSKDIMWIDKESDVPVISTVYQSFTTMQYDTTNIVYTVYDPLNESPTVTISTGVYDDDNNIEMSVVSTQVLTSKTTTYSFKPSVAGNHVIEIKCGVTTKILHATVEKISIDVTPVTAGLVFDFNPVGYSNDDDYRLWKDGSVSMSVSDNFDWVNGGYQFDENGDQYLCVKAGTFVTIDHKLFSDDAKVNGKEMKLVFKTTNISVPNTRFLHCIDNTTGYDFVGVEMFTQEAKVYCGVNDYLTLPYSEEDIIEFEFNITPIDSEIPMIMGYEDGVSTSPLAYDVSGANFTQNTPQSITIGSNYCDIHVYRLKAYNTALTAKGILNNFIADARSAEEMINRYNRNQIYKNVDGAEILDPFTLAEKCPWLRVVIVEAPRFTQDKEDKVSNTTVTYMYKNGDPVLDNWVATNCIHNGQGTSSNDYGAAGRNLLLDLKKSGLIDDTGKEIKPKITLGDGSTTKKITLTRNSVEINRLNFKVNVASCEHANNALLQKRFDTYNPYKRAFVRGAGDTEVGKQIEDLEDEIKDLNKTIKKNNQKINGLDPVNDAEDIAEIQLQINGLDPVENAEEIAELQKQIDGLDPVEDADEIAELQEKNAEANTEISNLESQIAELEKLVPDAIVTEISKIRDTMEFVNAVLFIRETDPDITQHTEFADNDYHFYSIGNIGDSKKNDSTKLTDPDDPYECIVEILDVDKPLSTFPSDEESLNILDNVEDFSGTGTYEYRYIYEDGTDEENTEAWNYCANKWREFYKFIVQSSDEDFKAHLGDYMVLDSALYYYLYTLRYMMVDNRAKNTFFHYGKTEEVDKNGEPIRKWDMSFNYDDDTGLGTNNYGKMAYRYGLEDFDVDDAGDEVFRGSRSTFFCRIRDLFADELCDMYNTLESKGCWNSNSLINQFETWQNEFPEELWRLGIERVYIRTYNSSFISGAGETRFFNTMCHGRKKYSRRQFERSQEKYMSSKFQSTVAINDKATIRCTNPSGNLVVPVSYKLKLTPYAYMYLNCAFGATTGDARPVQIRAVPNKEYEIPYDGKNLDILNVYSASLISSFGDLSSFYADTVDVGTAAKLKNLIIGNGTEGYNNPYLTSVALKTNPLLETLNIENVSNLTMSFDLSAMNNLKNLYAHGSNIGSVTFADSGKIEVAELPAITSFSMKNLIYLTNLDIVSLDKLTSLIVENCNTIDLITILTKAKHLNRIRVANVSWELEDTSLLEKLYKMKGFSKDGYNIEQSVLSGTVTVPIIGQYELYKYQETWPDLTIIPRDGIIPQYKVAFKNYDGTELDVQYIDQYGSAVDPITRETNPIDTPTKESTVQYSYIYSGWDKAFSNIVMDIDVYATYEETLRDYTIQYVSMGVPVKTATGKYGDNIVYDGVIPTYTASEPTAFYLFNRWDKSGFLTGDFDKNGVKTVTAIFDKFTGNSTYFNDKELSDLSPVEIYAMTKLNVSEIVITNKDPYSFTIGNDIDYDDIESELLISEKTHFNGSNHIDTGVQLFDEDKDFVLAIDYEFLSGNTSNAVLAQCFQSNGTNGFKLWYSSASGFTGARLTWGTTSDNIVGINKREIIVIRHKKGENNLTIYKSNLDGNDVQKVELTRTKSTIGNCPLVFGCARADDGIYENHAIGNVNWAKVWFADLGDDVCKNLAMWTHESITLEACGFRKYYLSDNTSKRCSFSLLASHLLGRAKAWNTSNTNAGGWADSSLNKSLNNRLYNAIPTQIKLLLKKVIVYSSIGQMSSELSSSDCYITIPALIEVDPTQTSEPYNSEGTSISYMVTNTDRKRAFDGGDYNAYWLRTPNVGYANYIWRVEADGQTQGITNATTAYGVLIEISF